MHDTHLTKATELDEKDPLKHFRKRFHFPHRDGSELIYFAGNSLGLQPRTVQDRIDDELDEWKARGVDGHMNAENPWFSYHHMFKEPLAEIVGAKPHEVVAMNTLTVNLHLMMISFYRPTKERYKIMIAGSEFPSDRYAVESQIRMHGFDPKDAMIEISPLKGAETLDQKQIDKEIKKHGNSLALVLFSGVHYYTGQFFDLPAITKAAHAVGAKCGFDLAHAAGNVETHLHDSGADFAVWCSYKYLNSGPGGVGGAFVHERYADDTSLVRLAGWWGNDEATRFEMPHAFEPSHGADAWQISNAQVLSMAAHKASLDIFKEARMDRISSKRNKLTSFAEEVIDGVIGDRKDISIITPRDRAHRGAQLSIHFKKNGKAVFDGITERGVVADWRSPSVIRIAPAPLYNTFTDVALLGRHLAEIISEVM